MDVRTRKVLRALDNKDLSSLTKMIALHHLDPNTLIPDKGVSLFHLVIGHQSETFAFKITKLFLRFGGNPNVPSEDGVTPIHVAAAWGRTRILHMLLVNGGDPWLQDDDRKNAFNYAFEEQEWDAVEMLHYFQQMHSSAYKKEVENTPKFEPDFEKILLRKGQEIYEYGLPNDKEVKSVKTQIHSEFQENNMNSSNSPIVNKIKYFESNPSSSDIGWRKPEKSILRCSQDYYQTCCEFIVNSEDEKGDENNSSDIEREKAKHYVSSIHIDTSPLKTEELNPKNSLVILNKTSNRSLDKSSGDVRSQLFMELQEAVLRRSMLKLNKAQEENKKDEEPKQTSSSPSITKAANEKEVEDPSETKEVSCLYGFNLSNNSLLKHMSDFATKVMEEIELSESEKKDRKVNERHSSNTNIASTYLSCEDDSDFKDDDSKALQSARDFQNDSLLEKSNDSFMSIPDEYKFTDKEETEEKLIVTAPSSSSFSTKKEKKRMSCKICHERKRLNSIPSSNEMLNEEEEEEEDVEMVADGSGTFSDVSSAPSCLSYTSDNLRNELTSLGYNPGPINKTTKRLYMRKLWKLKKNTGKCSFVKKVPAYSHELEKTLGMEGYCIEKILSFAKLEEEMIESFENNQNRKWREGMSKTSFNYLLLDPRVSLNLPRRVASMSDLEVWKCFLSSIFYVGKGKRTRPFAHLYEAASRWHQNSQQGKSNGKIRQILEIWSENVGVICLQVFQNTIPVEAYTREASMIDAMAVENLRNAKGGEYYGAAATWTKRNKLRLGIYLLYKAMLIFLNEGERQIWPNDLS